MPADYTGFKENGIDIADKYISISDADLIEDDLTQEGKDLYLPSGYYAAGANTAGKLGDGTTTARPFFVLIEPALDWLQVEDGLLSTFGIKEAGTLWAWGDDLNGQLGQGTFNVDVSTPIQVGLGVDWVQVSAYTCVQSIKSDGTLWSWGAGSDGQIGDGTPSDNISSPVQVGSDTDWMLARTGLNSSYGIKTTGTLWSWGTNPSGQLGHGDNVNKSTPVQVGTDTNWVDLTSGLSMTIAIKTDGTLWSWGSNTSGQLGHGDTVNKSTPVQVGTDTNWMKVGQSFRFASAAIKTNGTLWTWGTGSFGQLGHGNSTNISTPLQVGSLTDWYNIQISEHTISIKKDGTLWAWGSGADGKKGDGTGNTSSPTQVGVYTDWKRVSIAYTNSAAQRWGGWDYE
jgi:alpha-tubulin suppressor-like RCC1 family protein